MKWKILYYVLLAITIITLIASIAQYEKVVERRVQGDMSNHVNVTTTETTCLLLFVILGILLSLCTFPLWVKLEKSA